ncbi:MAG: DUF6798 domain-containing protein [Candidatus Sumerlaeia bacterium]
MASPTTETIQRAPARPRIQYSTLALGLVLVLLLYLHFLHNGYRCFRTDHLTHIPLFYKMTEPGLFPRDWYMLTSAPIELRRFHLLLLQLGDRLFGMPVGILVSYCAIILGTLAAWLAISRRLFASVAPGLVAIFMAIMVHDMEIGSNHLIEGSLIPRAEAALFAWWGIYFLLGSRRRDWPGGLAAGLLMALAGYFQPAIGAQFGLAILLWMMIDPQRRDWARIVTFLAALILPQAGKLLSVAGGVLKEASALTDAEQIRLFAYIRHPHHMIPHFWGDEFALLAGLLLVFAGVWWARRGACAATRSLARLAGVIVALLAAMTLFIEVWPVKAIVLFQPFRLAVLLYPVLFLVLGRHVADLAAAGGYANRARAMLLMCAPQGWALMIPAGAVEFFATGHDAHGRRLDWKWTLGLLGAACAVAIALNHDFDEAVVWILLAPALVMLAEKWRLAERPAIVYGALGSAVALGAMAISAFFWLPLDRWIGDDASPNRRRAAALAFKYQFKPIPIAAIERIGAWAGAHTEPDALFIVPPAREPEGFRIWSKRSVWFNIKFFPFRAGALEEWRNRYLAVRGIPDATDPARAADVERALNDVGGDTIQKDYAALTADQIVALGRRIVASKLEGPGPLYIVTPTAYRSPALELLYQDADRSRTRLDRNRNYLYRIHLN